MLRYDNEGNVVIGINLHNGYRLKVIATWDRETQKYKVDTYIKHDEVDMLDLIEEGILFDSDAKVIKTDIAKYVTARNDNGVYQYNIDRYDYILKCFDAGSSLFEKNNGGEV